MCRTTLLLVGDRAVHQKVTPKFGIHARSYVVAKDKLKLIAGRFFLTLCAVVFRTRPAIQAVRRVPAPLHAHTAPMQRGSYHELDTSAPILRHAMLQGVAIFVITVATLFQLAAPYWDWRTSALDFVACFSITVNCVALLYFSNQDFASPTEFSAEQTGASDLDSILVFVNALNIFLICAVFAVTIIEVRFKAWSIKKLCESVSQTAVNLQKSIFENRCALYDALEMSDVSDQSDSKEVVLEDFLAAVQHCRSHTQAPPSRGAIKALFFILKLVQGDDQPRSLWMSPEMRKDLSSATKGVNKRLVRVCFCRE
jgi:hypothetical protein